MKERGFVFTAGQRKIYKQGEPRIVFPKVPYTPAEIISGIPRLEIHPSFAAADYVTLTDVTEYIPYVNSKMVDWWWANMEKGYHLWAPGEHYGFDWIVPPCEAGYEGSVEASYEFDPANPLIITRQNLKEYPYTDCFKHCWVSTLDFNPGEMLLVHMYQDEKDGIYWRSVVSMKRSWYEKVGNAFENMPELGSHMAYESGRLNAFLPQLYTLWKDHPDPWENVAYDLSTKQNSDGTWSHVHVNPPPSLQGNFM